MMTQLFFSIHANNMMNLLVVPIILLLTSFTQESCSFILPSFETTRYDGTVALRQNQSILKTSSYYLTNNNNDLKWNILQQQQQGVGRRRKSTTSSTRLYKKWGPRWNPTPDSEYYRRDDNDLDGYDKIYYDGRKNKSKFIPVFGLTRIFSMQRFLVVSSYVNTPSTCTIHCHECLQTIRD